VEASSAGEIGAQLGDVAVVIAKYSWCSTTMCVVVPVLYLELVMDVGLEEGGGGGRLYMLE
jgi:hypothetical protein